TSPTPRRRAGRPAAVTTTDALEEPRATRVDAAHLVVVEHDAADAAVLGERARLRLDLLRGEHARDGRDARVAVEQLEVARQLLDAVDLAAALDLDRD